MLGYGIPLWYLACTAVSLYENQNTYGAFLGSWNLLFGLASWVAYSFLL